MKRRNDSDMNRSKERYMYKSRIKKKMSQKKRKKIYRKWFKNY